MRRSLLNKLNEKAIGVASLTCGIYMQNWQDYIILTQNQRQQAAEVKLLDPDILSQEIVKQLLSDNGIDLVTFTRKQEWDAYTDLKKEWQSLEPPFYRSLI